MRSLTVLILAFLGSLAAHAQAPTWRELMHDPNARFFDVQRSFYEEWAKNPQMPGWKQFKRWEWERQGRIDSAGHYDPSWISTQYANYRNLKPVRFRSARLASPVWRSLGPDRVPVNSYDRGVGRIDCMAFHPTDSLTFYVGSPHGGVWKTTDDGKSWKPLSDNWV